MQFPHIHINGTSPSDLFEGYVKAMKAASDLIDALRGTVPHGRDYYPIQNGDAVSVAMSEHLARAKMADTIYREMQALALYVQEQGSL